MYVSNFTLCTHAREMTTVATLMSYKIVCHKLLYFGNIALVV